GERAGLIPTTDWKRAVRGQRWQVGDTFNAGIGQGFVLASPLQLAVMAARIANGKTAVRPTLIIGQNLEQSTPLDIDPQDMAFIQNAMRSVCEVPGGTAYKPNGLGILGMEMAGKTGTGQVRGISAAERLSGVQKNKDLPWKLRDHSIFVGYAPYNNPRFAAAVLVEHGGSGAGIALKIFRATMSKALKDDGIESAI
ncbi:MAG: penicillin-binding protein 2, partial [Robiginitomaculum sp.]|nr:penicillin-binding protein 2 [Robiginitomaculum sp.]